MNKRRQFASIPERRKRGDAAEEAERRDEDTALVARSVRGDREAFRVLFERYKRRAYALALGVVHDPDDALDVVQEAFLKAHRNLASFEGAASFYTWLYRIVMNVAIDHLRKASRNVAVDYDDAVAHEDEGGLLPIPAGVNPARELERRETREQLEAALAKLSPTHRATLLLREVDGLSYEEMASVMKVSKGTIMSRLFYARRYMQKFLRELLGGPKDPEV